MRFETRAIHVGQEPEPTTGAVITPIFQTSTYAQVAPGQHRGHEYSRTSNPTRTALQECLASLELASHGFAFSSGLGALTTLLALFKPGDHIVSGHDIYGGTYRLLTKVFSRFGLHASFVDTANLAEVAAAIQPTTRMIWVESPTNPLLAITDIRAAAQLANARGILLGVDNTFMSPFLQQPLALGAHVVLHSTTKYIGGHSDVVGGFLATSDEILAEEIAFHQNAIGATPGPFDAWLTLRGLKTLAVRMRAHEENAHRIAQFLVQHDKVKDVLYPGLSNHPGHLIHRNQADGFGGMISFRVHGGLEAAKKLCTKTKLFILAESLGGVESLIEHPAIMTHASMPAAERVARGLTDDLVRISVGIEHQDDLVQDLSRALESI